MPSPRTPHNIAFGRALREYRLKRRPPLTQAELALLAGLDRTYISLLELGDRSPTLTTMLVLADALEISPLKLLKRALEELQTLQDED